MSFKGLTLNDYVFFPQCVYGVCKILKLNSGYFLKQQ
jgi:hypothetical protein